MLVALTFFACIDTGVVSTAEDAPETAPVIDPNTHDADHDGTVDANDCKPYDSDIHPRAPEVCDGIDNNCDNDIDDGDYDADDDGFDDVVACYPLVGSWDCNDEDPAIHPGAPETCDYADENCDGVIDNGDADGDGIEVCEDCDDADAFVLPGAAEACDGLDNNCDGVIDELWDFDGDGTSGCAGDCDDGDPEIGPLADDICDGVDNNCDSLIDELHDLDGDGVATCSGDCNDGDATVYLGAAEVCDGKDNDCNAATPESTDVDGDGYTLCAGDCNDASAAAHPGGIESCDGVDDDCNGRTDELPECFGCTASSSYLLCSSSRSWPLAETACEDLGGTLAFITSSSENDDLAELAVRATWIGANDRDNEGDYVWPNGSTVGYESWASSEPSGSDSLDCAFTNNGGRRGDWAISSCDSSYPFLCEL